MKLLIQRVREAAVAADGKTIGQIGHGLLVFVGVADTDTKQIADKLVDKMTKLRIFDADVQGEFLIVSQFTLYADCRKGNRPSFTDAGNPQLANELYEYIIDSVKAKGFHTEHGSFGADMKVSLLNDGPFTIMLDSNEIIK